MMHTVLFHLLSLRMVSICASFDDCCLMDVFVAIKAECYAASWTSQKLCPVLTFLKPIV